MSIIKRFLHSIRRADTDATDQDHSEVLELNKKDAFDRAVIVGFDIDGEIIEAPNVADDSSPVYTMKGRRGLSALALLCSQDYDSTDSGAVNVFKSIHQGNTTTLDRILENYTPDELNKLNVAGQSLLHLVCMKEDIRALEIILKRGGNVEQLNSDGVTPLHVAVCIGWVEGVEELLYNDAITDVLPVVRIDSKWPWQELPIHTACRSGDNVICQLLLEKKPDLSFPNFENNLVLHLATYSHNFDLISSLLEQKVVREQISSTNEKGNTPLHMLMLGENMTVQEEEIADCIKLLLRNGADVDRVNASGRSCLLLAARANLPLVVEVLLEARANSLIIGNDGRNVLHAACRAGSHETLSMLLQTEKVRRLVLQTDLKDLAPFHLAVSSCSIACCELLLQHGDHLTNKDSMNRTRCSLVLKNMPSAVQLLKKVFDSHVIISDNDASDPEFSIEMDFNVLLSKSNVDVEASLIADFGSTDAESLLKHPLIESFLYLKWHKIKLFFYCYVIAYFIFLIIHTYYIIKTFNMNTDWKTEYSTLEVVYWLHAALLITLIVPGTIIIFANVKKYVRQWETYFKLFALFTASFVVFTQGSSFFSDEVSRNVASTSIFFTWVEFMMLLGRFPSLGIYILMFTKVSKSVLRFLLAFSPLIIAFALSFSILLRSTDPFDTFPAVFVRTLMMMIGEIEFTDIYTSTQNEGQLTMIVSQIFLVVFVVLIPILMTNLLIGLAVSDLPDLQLQGKIRRLVKEASYLESYEKLLIFFKDMPPVPVMVTGALSGKGSIKRKITIWPNQRHRKDCVTVPMDAIKEAINSGTKLGAKGSIDLDSAFKSFYVEYQKDRQRFEGALETLYTAVTQQRTLNEDTVDGKVSKRKMKKTLYGRKLRRLLVFKE